MEDLCMAIGVLIFGYAWLYLAYCYVVSEGPFKED